MTVSATQDTGRDGAQPPSRYRAARPAKRRPYVPASIHPSTGLET